MDGGSCHFNTCEMVYSTLEKKAIKDGMIGSSLGASRFFGSRLRDWMGILEKRKWAQKNEFELLFVGDIERSRCEVQKT